MIQLKVDDAEHISDRTDRTIAMLDEAMPAADIVMLPELWPTGAFNLENGIAHAEPIDGPLVQRLSSVAAKHSTWLHGGSFVEVAGDNYFNTSVVFNAEGELVAKYRKIHLFGFDVGEAAALTAGGNVAMVETPLGMTGLATCYDLRFPELFRLMHNGDVTAVLAPTGWPLARIDAWLLFARARAAENQMWLFGCNEVGSQAGVELGGNSVIVNPLGEITDSNETTEALLTANIDPTEPDRLRSDFPVLKDRRIRIEEI